VTDDVIARKTFIAQVKIPDIVIDAVQLAPGQVGVDYTVVVPASGGVPPLSFELEYVDGNGDGVADPGDALTQGIFGIEIDANTGYFFGVPRASSTTAGGVDLTVRVYAAVMNPVQGAGNPMNPVQGAGNPPPPVPTGGANEFDGTLFPGGEAGRHKTFTVFFAPPTVPYVATTSLPSGADGQGYSAGVSGGGGVPRLVPYPVGFTGTYPSGTAARSYTWDPSYDLDSSHPDGNLGLGNEGDTVQGMPNALTMVTDPLAGTNGQISGIIYDRGVHTIAVGGLDDYVGDGTDPKPTPLDTPPGAGDGQTPFTRDLVLSVGPDQALYLRGDPAGTASGLLDEAKQKAEQRMVPMFQAAGVFTMDASGQPQIFSGLPNEIDLLPILLPNGGSDAHNRKSIPSVSGAWPAESASEWAWFYGGRGPRAWNHLQQENVWAQAPNASQSRVFLWAETKIKSWKNQTGYGWGKRYQQYETGGKRGAFVLNPVTGDFFVPAILSNNSTAQGDQFGGETMIGWHKPAYGYCFLQYGQCYWKGYYYASFQSSPLDDTGWDREVQVQGLGSYIEANSSGNSQQGWYKTVQGRTATSLAMSSDGLWCATAMPGGGEQKILLFRTDGQPIPNAILSQTYVTGVNGLKNDGSTFTNSACIVNVGGEDAGGKTITSNQRYLLPDSLMFVQGGLLFLNETNLDHVFGLSLNDGDLSSVDLNSSARVEVNGAGTGPTVQSNDGQYVPDQEWLRGLQGGQSFSVQFGFTGNKPAAGATGPSRVAFVAGDNKQLYAYTDLGAQPRDGYLLSGNRAKSLLFLELANTNDLDLSAATLKDLTGGDSRIYGDLLTPGRPGEELDWVAVSDSGDFAAVVREYGTEEWFNVSTYDGRVYDYYGYVPTFHIASLTYSSYYGNASRSADDLLLISTQGVDMDSGSSAGNGDQHILYIGSHSYTDGTSSNPSVPTAYVTGRPYLNSGTRRINGVMFGSDDRTLIFNYSGHERYNVKYSGGTYSYVINPGGYTNTTYNQVGVQQSMRLQFRTSTGGAINYTSSSTSGSNTAGTNFKNNLQGLNETNISRIGDTTLNFGRTNTSQQLFWATFKSANGDFLYYISDQLNQSLNSYTNPPPAPTAAYRNYMVGFNISGGTINGHTPYTPFSPHAATVGFEQFDVNSWNYENRFASVPGGVSFQGRDGAGVLCVIASAASAGPVSATDLEVFVMDADNGGDMYVLTSDVTNGTRNAINYLYLSLNGNVLVGQRAQTDVSSRDRRDQLTGRSDLFVVTNVHAAMGGAAPDGFIVSANQSHGSTVALLGEGMATGPWGVAFSSAAPRGNATWEERTLKFSALAPGGSPAPLDSTESHYVVLAADRILDDDASTSD
jgi:hypothetical protein